MNNKFENENYIFAQNCSERQKLPKLLEPQKGAPNGKTNVTVNILTSIQKTLLESPYRRLKNLHLTRWFLWRLLVENYGNKMRVWTMNLLRNHT